MPSQPHLREHAAEEPVGPWTRRAVLGGACVVLAAALTGIEQAMRWYERRREPPEDPQLLEALKLLEKSDTELARFANSFVWRAARFLGDARVRDGIDRLVRFGLEQDGASADFALSHAVAALQQAGDLETLRSIRSRVATRTDLPRTTRQLDQILRGR